MKITVNIDDHLLTKVNRLADEDERTLEEIVEEALLRFLIYQKGTAISTKLELTVVSGEGLRPGVNLDASADLLGIMDNTGDS